MGVIFKLLMKFITVIANFFLAPINALVVNVFPDLTDKLNYFESAMNRLFTPLLSWFFHLLPPYARSFILFYILILVVLYTTSLAIHVVLKVIKIIQNVKIW